MRGMKPTRLVIRVLRKGQLGLFDQPVTVHAHQMVTHAGQAVQVPEYQSHRKKKPEEEEAEKRPLLAWKPPVAPATPEPTPAAIAAERRPEPEVTPKLEPGWRATVKQSKQESPHDPGRVKKLVDYFHAGFRNGIVPTDPRAIRQLAVTHVGGNPEEYTDDLYDSIEGGLARHHSESSKNAPTDSIGDRLERADRHEQMMPRRNRTLELSELQQFSTPLTISEAVQIAASPRPGETVLEPTGGTGNLIGTLAAHHDGPIHINELAERRVNVLKHSEWPDNVKVEKGNYLARKGKADVVVTNPPWGKYTSGKYGKPIGLEFTPADVAERFVAKNMRDLNDGGRLVAVMPTTMLGPGGATFRRWLDENHTVRAMIEMPGDWYSRRGTSIGSVLLVVDKGKHGDAPAPITRTLEHDERGRSVGTYPLIELAGLLQPLAEGGTHGRTPVSMFDRTPEAKKVTEALTTAKEHANARTKTDEPGAPTGGAGSEPEPAGGGSRAADRLDTGKRAGGEPGVRVRPTEPRVDSPVVADARQRAADDPSPEGGMVSSEPSRELRAAIDADRAEQAARAKDSPIYTEFVRPYAHARGLPHPRLVTESRNLAAVAAPDLTYEPHESVLRANKLGRLSNEALIGVAAARQANENGSGFLLSDATGLGKSAAAGAYALDLIKSGKAKKILVFTKAKPNVQDLMQHFGNVAGGKKDPKDFPATMFYVPDYKDSSNNVFEKEESRWTPLPVPTKLEGGKTVETPAIYFMDHAGGPERYEKAIMALGADALIADEAHSFINVDSKRGTLWTGLHKNLMDNDSPILYLTATAATSLNQFEYLYGLKEWQPGEFNQWTDQIAGHLVEAKAGRGGVGTGEDEESDLEGETASVQDFSASPQGQRLAIKRQGKGKKKKEFMRAKDSPFRPQFTPAEQEQVIRELKMKGKFMGRDLWREPEFAAHEVPLDTEEKAEFDKAMNLLRDVRKTHYTWGAADKTSGMKPDPTSLMQFAVKRILGHYRLKRAIKLAQEAVARGEQPVISIMSVNEDDPSGETKTGFVHGAINTINTRQKEKDEDTGEAVDMGEIPEAALAVAELKERARDEWPHLPDPIEMVRDAFPGHTVAAITGRVASKDRKKVREDFQTGKSQVAIISTAGKTGISLHDKNGKQRHLIVSDYEWSSPKFMQELGRVDRTGQKSNPKITAVHMGAAGEKKFIATIANRLASLGATSKGSAESGSVDALDEFEFGAQPQDTRAMQEIWRELPEDEKNQFLHRDFKDQHDVTEGQGKDKRTKPVHERMAAAETRADIATFLRELQWMPNEKSDAIFERWFNRRQELLSGGDTDAMMSRTIPISAQLDKTTPLSEDEKEPLHLHEFDATDVNPKSWKSFENLGKVAGSLAELTGTHKSVWHKDDVAKFNKKIGDLQWKLREVRQQKEAMDENYPADSDDEWAKEQRPRYQEVIDRKMKEIKELPHVKEFLAARESKPQPRKVRKSIVAGMVTPRMHQLRNFLERTESGGPRRVYQRIKADDGKEYVGLTIPEENVEALREQLAVEGKTDKKPSPSTALHHLGQGKRLQLANGWKLYRSKDGKVRFEGTRTGTDKDTLQRHGAKFSAVGTYWWLPDEHVEDFVRHFKLTGLAKSFPTRLVVRRRVAS